MAGAAASRVWHLQSSNVSEGPAGRADGGGSGPTPGPGLRRGLRSRCGRRIGHRHHCRHLAGHSEWGTLPNLRANRSNVGRLDRPGHALWDGRHLDCRRHGRHHDPAAGHLPAGQGCGPHTGAGYRRVHERHRHHHCYRPDRQLPRNLHSAGRKRHREAALLR